MKTKAKGSNAERELLHSFWEHGIACMRAAGSGSTRHPCPDLIAGTPLRKLAIECKATGNVKQYLSQQQIAELRTFSTLFAAEPWIAVRFDHYSKKDELGWYFLTLDDLRETEGNNYVISVELAKLKGLRFSELINTPSLISARQN